MKFFKLYCNPSYWFASTLQKQKLQLETSNLSPYELETKLLELEYNPNISHPIGELMRYKEQQYELEVRYGRMTDIQADAAFLKDQLDNNVIDGFTYEKEVFKLTNRNTKDIKIFVNDLNLKYNKITIEDHTKTDIEIKFEYGDYTPYERDIALAKMSDDVERQLLEVNLIHKRITAEQYAYELAELQGVPYGKITLMFNPSTNNIICETAMNNPMLDLIKQNGNAGLSDDQLADSWVESVCRSVIINNFERN